MTTAAVLAETRRLSWVTWRLHRTSLVVVLGLAGLTAAVMAVSELDPRWRAGIVDSGWIGALFPLIMLDLWLLPVLAGLILGAPLVAHEEESGLARFAWTQGTGKGTQLTAKALCVAAGLAGTAAGLGLELSWWARPELETLNWDWLGPWFTLHPLSYAGWMVFGFSLGIVAGAATRRTVPALVATLAGYVAVFYLDNWLRPFYLPPLRMTHSYVLYSARAAHFFRLVPNRINPAVIARQLMQPDGRPIARIGHSPAWLVAHHILQWTTYQPGSRYPLFQVMEFGYLMVLSAALVTAAVALVRRRAA